MPKDQQIVESHCSKCDSDTMQCTHNYFRDDVEEIHSWEHRCLNCGDRQTQAYRSGDEEGAEELTKQCPFCGRGSG